MRLVKVGLGYITFRIEGCARAGIEPQRVSTGVVPLGIRFGGLKHTHIICLCWLNFKIFSSGNICVA